MNREPYYTKEVIDLKVEAIHARLSGQDRMLEKILAQTTKTNGRMTRMEKIMLVVGTAIAVLLVVNGSSLVTFGEALIK